MKKEVVTIWVKKSYLKVQKVIYGVDSIACFFDCFRSYKRIDNYLAILVDDFGFEVVCSRPSVGYFQLEHMYDY